MSEKKLNQILKNQVVILTKFLDNNKRLSSSEFLRIRDSIEKTKEILSTCPVCRGGRK